MEGGDDTVIQAINAGGNNISRERRELFLLLENPSKGNNLGPIIRCAAAFAIRTIVAVGYDKCSTEGAHGAGKHVEIVAFPVLDQAVSYLRNDCQCTLLIGLLGGSPYENRKGKLIVNKHDESSTVQGSHPADEGKHTPYPCSVPVQDVHPFSQGSCCLVISKNWRGLPVSLAGCCDVFAHIPHVHFCGDGEDKSSAALLDTQSCLSIALHYFAPFADYSEHEFGGHKFKVVRQQKDNEREAKAATRQEAKRLVAHETEQMSEYNNSLVFGKEPCEDY